MWTQAFDVCHSVVCVKRYRVLMCANLLYVKEYRLLMCANLLCVKEYRVLMCANLLYVSADVWQSVVCDVCGLMPGFTSKLFADPSPGPLPVSMLTKPRERGRRGGKG